MISEVDRSAMLRRIAAETFDLVVVGGGITGAGVAREAALRGISVALVERADFAYGTSSRSTKLIHGGLRYLRSREFGLVREAVRERQRMLRMAPHLVRPLTFVLPVYAGDPDPLWLLRLGLVLYDVFAGRGNAIRRRVYPRERALAVEPLLRREDLSGAVGYGDSVTDDARLVLEVITSAIGHGAVAANYLEALGIRRHGEVTEIRLRDVIAREDLYVRSRRVLNAAGPWADDIRRLADPHARPLLRLTKGVHVSVLRDRLPLRHAVTMRGRDGRIMFAVPSGEFAYLGTTDTDLRGAADAARIERSDVEYILAAAARYFPGARLGAEDVRSAWVGVRPLVASTKVDPSAVSRGYELFREDGLVTVAGGKLTAFRSMASHIVDQLFRGSGGRHAARRSIAPLPGATTRSHAAEIRRLAAALGRPMEAVELEARRYGSVLPDVLAGDPGPGHLTAAHRWLVAQLRHAVRREMAMRLEDVLVRRTGRLLFSADNGLTYVDELAVEMGRLLGWPAERVAEEASRYRALVQEQFLWREPAG